jgi:TetR/AcrR family transcriptional repressor of nem operon
VRKGSFCYFFPTKRELALADIDERWKRAQANILEPAFTPDVEPLERIVRFFHRAAEHQRGEVVLGCPSSTLAAAYVLSWMSRLALSIRRARAVLVRGIVDWSV